MVFPLWFGPRFFGRDASFGAVLSNAAADGKRQRVIDVSLTRGSRFEPAETGLTAWRGDGLLIRRLGLGGILWFDRRLCSRLGLCRLRSGLIAGG
jgi:hypothetical protein